MASPYLVAHSEFISISPSSPSRRDSYTNLEKSCIGISICEGFQQLPRHFQPLCTNRDPPLSVVEPSLEGIPSEGQWQPLPCFSSALSGCDALEIRCLVVGKSLKPFRILLSSTCPLLPSPSGTPLRVPRLVVKGLEPFPVRMPDFCR